MTRPKDKHGQPSTYIHNEPRFRVGQDSGEGAGRECYRCGLPVEISPTDGGWYFEDGENRPMHHGSVDSCLTKIRARVERQGACDRCGATDSHVDASWTCSTCVANYRARVEAANEILQIHESCLDIINRAYLALTEGVTSEPTSKERHATDILREIAALRRTEKPCESES